MPLNPNQPTSIPLAIQFPTSNSVQVANVSTCFKADNEMLKVGLENVSATNMVTTEIATCDSSVFSTAEMQETWLPTDVVSRRESRLYQPVLPKKSKNGHKPATSITEFL